MPSSTAPATFHSSGDWRFGTRDHCAARPRAGGCAVNARAWSARLVLLVAAAGILPGSAARAGAQVFTIDPATSRVVIHVGKSGIFSFAGHTHEIVAPLLSGRVSYEPADPQRSSVTAEFDASALQVTGKDEPASDVPEVQRTMLGERVLDVKRFPKIVFESRRVAVTDRNGDRLSLRVTGDLTLHGVTRPATAAVDVAVARDSLTATGTLTVRQTSFGIEPVTAGAGTVRVKDALDITFSLHARQ